MRRSKPGSAGSMRVNTSDLPHLEQGGRRLGTNLNLGGSFSGISTFASHPLTKRAAGTIQRPSGTNFSKSRAGPPVEATLYAPRRPCGVKTAVPAKEQSGCCKADTNEVVAAAR